MITDMNVRVACDRDPLCQPAWILLAGSEVDYVELEERLKFLEWEVEKGEHICPACVEEWKAERAVNDEWMDAPERNDIRAINAGRM